MIKIVQGNDVNLHVPLVEKNSDGTTTAIDFANVTDLDVSLSKGSEAFTDFTQYTVDNTVVICLNENAPRGSYSIQITAKNNGVDICYNAKSAFEIVRYNAESTYTDYIADEDVTLDTGLFVAAIVNDTQVEELREELQAKIAETEQAKEDYDAAADNLIDLAEDLGGISETVENAVEDAMQGADVAKQGTDPTVTLTIIKGLLDNLDLTNVAKQGTDPTATLTAIKSALDNMDISNVAKQGDNPNATNTAILAAFGNIDFSTLAKQGVNSNATNTAILQAVSSIDLSSLATLSGQQSAAADLLTLKTRIGEATDATTANTLFGKIAAVLSLVSGLDLSSVATEANATANKNAILNDIAAKASAILGTDTTATLTALKTAIAGLSIPTVQQIQSGLAKTSELPTDYAKQGSNANATLSDTQGAVKNSTTTALAELLNNTYGLAALQTLIGAITGYALQGSDTTATNTAIKNAIANIDLSVVAKQGSDATATLTAVASAIATLATAVAAIPTTTPATPSDLVSAVNTIIGAMPSVSGLASETSVKDGNDTAISMLKDGTFGLSAIKTIVQAISGYALQGSDPTATNTAMNTLIGSPAVGQQPTLFKAIAAVSGGGGGGGGDVQISAADWTALITAVNQLTGSELVYADTAQDVIDEITAIRNGVTFANIANWWSLPTLLCNNIWQYVTSIIDGRVSTVVADAFRNNTIITKIELPNCISVGTYAFASSHIEIVKLPSLTTLPTEIFYQNTYLKYVDMSSCVNNAYRGFYQTYNIQAIVTSTGVPCNSGYSNAKLYLLHFKGSIINSLNLCYDSHNGLLWNPTEAVDSNSTSLVPQQEWDLDENGDPIDCTQFTSNKDKFLYCFKHLFMPAFGTVTSATLTLKSTVYDVVMNDNEVSTYFSTHGWTVARVA